MVNSRSLLSLSCFLSLLVLTAVGPSTGQDLGKGLKPGEGRKLITTNCVACHSTALIVSHHMSRERWDKSITRMQEKEGLWPFSPEDREAILDYLESTQGPIEEAISSSDSPWAQPLYRPNPIWPKD